MLVFLEENPCESCDVSKLLSIGVVSIKAESSELRVWKDCKAIGSGIRPFYR
jgi:hypothetical protein